MPAAAADVGWMCVYTKFLHFLFLRAEGKPPTIILCGGSRAQRDVSGVVSNQWNGTGLSLAVLFTKETVLGTYAKRDGTGKSYHSPAAVDTIVNRARKERGKLGGSSLFLFYNGAIRERCSTQGEANQISSPSSWPCSCPVATGSILTSPGFSSASVWSNRINDTG